MASRELIAHLPTSRSAEVPALQAVRERLNVNCEATYDEFSRVLHQLRDARGLSVRPVLVIDEFVEKFARRTHPARLSVPDVLQWLAVADDRRRTGDGGRLAPVAKRSFQGAAHKPDLEFPHLLHALWLAAID